jgi:hypothetical protein
MYLPAGLGSTSTRTGSTPRVAAIITMGEFLRGTMVRMRITPRILRKTT